MPFVSSLSRTTPYYSLYMLKKALVSVTPGKFSRYLDTDSILDNMGKERLHADGQRGTPRNKFEQHMRARVKTLQPTPAQLMPMGESITILLLPTTTNSSSNLAGHVFPFRTPGNTAESASAQGHRIILTMADPPKATGHTPSIPKNLNAGEVRGFQVSGFSSGFRFQAKDLESCNGSDLSHSLMARHLVPRHPAKTGVRLTAVNSACTEIFRAPSYHFLRGTTFLCAFLHEDFSWSCLPE
jgi:hypothetical protein